MKSKCFVIDGGSNDAEHSVFTKGYGVGKNITVPVVVVLIKHPLANILVDTGVIDTDSYPAKMHNYVTSDKGSVVDQLKELGISCDDIDYVISTHLHWDHSGYARVFKNARNIVRTEEIEFARSEAKAGNPYYRPEDFDHPDIKYVYIPSGSGDITLLDGIRLIFTPGHTAGAQSVLVDTNEGEVLIASDTLYMYELNYKQGIMPGVCFSEDDQRNTIKKINDLGDIIVIPGHDPYMKLKKVYG